MTAIRTIANKISIRRFSTVLQPPARIKSIFRINRQQIVSKNVNYHLSAPSLSSTSNDEENENSDDEEIRVYDREFVEMKVEDFAELYKDNPNNKDKIQTILNDYEYVKYNTVGRVPSVIEVTDMHRIIDEGTSPMTRTNMLHYLFTREMDKRASIRKKEKLKEQTRIRREAKYSTLTEMNGKLRSGLLSENGNIIYGLWHNSLFCRIPENKLKSGSSSSRLRNAALFGRKLIFDFGFEEYMVKWTYRNAIDQVQEAYGLNRFQYRDPFDLWFCNFDKNSFASDYIEKKAMQNLRTTSMITVKEDCFTNHFDKSRLVYLSPNAKEPLGKIHKSDDIYIIGVYNDKGNQQPVTMRKATKLGIRTKCLPLDAHVAWGGSSKSLCVNHVTGILLEVMANGGDWKAALMKHVPSRKIKPSELVMEEEQRRLDKIRLRRRGVQFNIRQDLD